MDRLTKKQLIALATRLNAKVIAKDIEQYGNALHELISDYYTNGHQVYSEIVAYCAGFHENTGRVDKIIDFDTNECYFVCWY